MFFCKHVRWSILGTAGEQQTCRTGVRPRHWPQTRARCSGRPRGATASPGPRRSVCVGARRRGGGVRQRRRDAGRPRGLSMGRERAARRAGAGSSAGRALHDTSKHAAASRARANTADSAEDTFGADGAAGNRCSPAAEESLLLSSLSPREKHATNRCRDRRSCK